MVSGQITPVQILLWTSTRLANLWADTLAGEIAKLMAGDLRRMPQLRLGTKIHSGKRKNNDATTRPVPIFGKIENGELTLWIGPVVGGTVSAGQMGCSLNKIDPMPHLSHLFEGFTSPHARSSQFRRVIEAYVNSSFPTRFNLIDDGDLKRGIEETLTIEAIRKATHRLLPEQTAKTKTGYALLAETALPLPGPEGRKQYSPIPNSIIFVKKPRQTF